MKDSTMPIKLNSSMPIAASRFKRPTNRSRVGEFLNSSHDCGSELNQSNKTYQYGTNRNQLSYSKETACFSTSCWQCLHIYNSAKNDKVFMHLIANFLPHFLRDQIQLWWRDSRLPQAIE